MDQGPSAHVSRVGTPRSSLFAAARSSGSRTRSIEVFRPPALAGNLFNRSVVVVAVGRPRYRGGNSGGGRRGHPRSGRGVRHGLGRGTARRCGARSRGSAKRPSTCSSPAPAARGATSSTTVGVTTRTAAWHAPSSGPTEPPTPAGYVTAAAVTFKVRDRSADIEQSPSCGHAALREGRH